MKVKVIKPYVDKNTGEYVSSAFNPVIEVDNKRGEELIDAGVAKMVDISVSDTKEPVVSNTDKVKTDEQKSDEQKSDKNKTDEIKPYVDGKDKNIGEKDKSGKK